MSDRQRFIRTAVIARPEIIAHAIRRVAWALDESDDQRKITYRAELDELSTGKECAAAWAAVAFMIADVAEVDSIRLRSIANGIWNGGQRELDY